MDQRKQLVSTALESLTLLYIFRIPVVMKQSFENNRTLMFENVCV